MNEQPPIRKLPKKSIFIIVSIVIAGAIALTVVNVSQHMKMQEILETLGYPNTSGITIYNKTPMQDDATMQRLELTKLNFTDLNTNKECFGFVLKNKKTGTYTKDIDCK